MGAKRKLRSVQVVDMATAAGYVTLSLYESVSLIEAIHLTLSHDYRTHLPGNVILASGGIPVTISDRSPHFPLLVRAFDVVDGLEDIPRERPLRLWAALLCALGLNGRSHVWQQLVNQHPSLMQTVDQGDKDGN